MVEYDLCGVCGGLGWSTHSRWESKVLGWVGGRCSMCYGSGLMTFGWSPHLAKLRIESKDG